MSGPLAEQRLAAAASAAAQVFFKKLGHLVQIVCRALQVKAGCLQVLVIGFEGAVGSGIVGRDQAGNQSLRAFHVGGGVIELVRIVLIERLDLADVLAVLIFLDQSVNRDLGVGHALARVLLVEQFDFAIVARQ